MTRTKTSWRDRQLNAFNLESTNFTILEQEKIMLDFVESCGHTSWKWLGDPGNFYNFFAKNFELSNTDYKGLIIFGAMLNGKSTSLICSTIKNLISDVQFVYCAINRYEIAYHDLDFELPDSMEQTIDCIMTYCHPDFKRLHKFEHIDGNHMVAAHPLDCFGLCK